MISRVVMPKLTDTMEEGVVVAWKKQEGDPVMAGDVLAEIETDKAVMDLEAFGSGFIRRILANEGETVKAGTLIAIIGELDEDIESALLDPLAPTAEGPPASQISQQQPANSTPGPPVKETPQQPSPESLTKKPTTKASPRARKAAEEKGIDLAGIQGSGPEGQILERDVLQQTEPTGPGQAATTEYPLSQMRKAIARVTTQSKGPVPHFYITAEIAMDEAEKLRGQFNQSQSEAVSMTSLFGRAAVLALTGHPEINASFAGETIRRHHQVDMGIAVALEDGLITPVVRDAARKSLPELSRQIRDLVTRARARQLTPAEYSGATFTISNLGTYEVESFIAVLMPPQASALAIGAIRTVPVVEEETIKGGRRVKVTLSCDHRALDGAQGAEFLQTFKHLLEHPLGLFLPMGSP